MKVNAIIGTMLCLLSVLVVLPADAAPKGQNMNCASLTFLNACALNGGFALCSKNPSGGPDTAMCCKDSSGGRRVCSTDPNDIARGAVAPRAPNAGTRTPMHGQNPRTPAKTGGVQKATQ